MYYYHTHLYSSLREINLHGQIFPREDVGIVSLRESGLEFLQLLEGESCPVSALFPPHEGILANSVKRWVIGGVTGICNECSKYCKVAVYFLLNILIFLREFHFPRPNSETHS